MEQNIFNEKLDSQIDLKNVQIIFCDQTVIFDYYEKKILEMEDKQQWLNKNNERIDAARNDSEKRQVLAGKSDEELNEMVKSEILSGQKRAVEIWKESQERIDYIKSQAARRLSKYIPDWQPTTGEIHFTINENADFCTDGNKITMDIMRLTREENYLEKAITGLAHELYHVWENEVASRISDMEGETADDLREEGIQGVASEGMAVLVSGGELKSFYERKGRNYEQSVMQAFERFNDYLQMTDVDKMNAELKAGLRDMGYFYVTGFEMAKTIKERKGIKYLKGIIKAIRENPSKLIDSYLELVQKDNDLPTLDFSEREIFEMKGIDSELLEHYKPRFLAKGGEHFVYEFPDHPGVVAKISFFSIRSIINENLANQQKPDSWDEGLQRRADSFLASEQERFNRIKNVFGKEHTLKQRKVVLKVPVTKELLKIVYQGNLPAELEKNIPQEVWAAASIQEGIGEGKRSSWLSFNINKSGDKVKERLDFYEQNTQSLIFNDPLEINKKQFVEGQPNENLKKIFELAETDTELRQQLQDLVGRLVRYLDKVGEVLDLSGQENIVFYKDDGKWTYKLIDVLNLGENYKIDDGKAAMVRLANNQQLADEEEAALKGVIRITRDINGLARFLGCNEMIDIIPQEIKNRRPDLETIIQVL